MDQEEQGEQQATQQRQEDRRIVELSATTTRTKRGVVHCLTIIGQIEGHMILPPQNKTTKYEHVIPQLVAVEESEEVDGLLIMLNTAGGDVEAGLAIAEMIASMEKPTVSLVLGGGHSIGVPLAVASRYSYIVPSATMTIHPIRMNGLVIGVPQTLSYFEKIQERIIRFITSNSRMKEETFRGYCFRTGELANDVGSVLTGEEAVSSGLIDELGGLSQALEKLYAMIEEQRRKQHDPQRDPAPADPEPGGVEERK